MGGTGKSRKRCRRTAARPLLILGTTACSPSSAPFRRSLTSSPPCPLVPSCALSCKLRCIVSVFPRVSLISPTSPPLHLPAVRAGHAGVPPLDRPGLAEPCHDPRRARPADGQPRSRARMHRSGTPLHRRYALRPGGVCAEAPIPLLRVLPGSSF